MPTPDYYQSAFTGEQIDGVIQRIISGDIDTAYLETLEAAKKAANSSTNASNHAKTAQSYAEGGTNSRPGEDTNNAKYYKTQAASSANKAEKAKNAIVNMTADATSVSFDTPASVEKQVSPEGAVTLKFNIPAGKINLADNKTVGGFLADPTTPFDNNPVHIGPDGRAYTAGGSGGPINTDDSLIYDRGVLKVNTQQKIQEDNTLPVSSGAVYVVVGNIESLLGSI